MGWAEHVARMGEDRGVHRVLVGKPEGKKPLGRPRHRWEDNIKMDLQDIRSCPFFLSFFLSLCLDIYLLTVGVEGYFCT